MRQTQFDRVIILSAELSNLDMKENDKRTANLNDCLGELGLGYSRALGVYNHRVETSFVVRINNETQYQLVKDLALESFKQECILYRDSKGQAYLEYGDKREHLGVLENMTEAKARANGKGFTILNNQYYAVA